MDSIWSRVYLEASTDLIIYDLVLGKRWTQSMKNDFTKCFDAYVTAGRGAYPGAYTLFCIARRLICNGLKLGNFFFEVTYLVYSIYTNYLPSYNISVIV
jgi:hypothetical protein